jgi:hypothetical protein
MISIKAQTAEPPIMLTDVQAIAVAKFLAAHTPASSARPSLR